MSLFDSLSPEARARAGIITTPVEKAIVGPGAAMIQYGMPISSFSRSPQKLMREAQALYHSHPWIHSAEATVTRAVVGMEWHLEDANNEEADDAAFSGPMKVAQDFLEKPQAALPTRRKMTRREMWSLTSRHMGLCGMAYWYLDQRDGLSGFPLAALYVNPARVWSAEDAAGNLVGWIVDPLDDSGRGGTPYEIDELIPFYLDPPDSGHLGTGLVEVAGLKARITDLIDRHEAFVLGMGGRMAGIVSPKEGILNDEQFKRLVREFRNVAEAPDSAKRTIILDGPIDFKQTAATPDELDLLDLAKMNRDDIFAIWGVPPALAGVPQSSGGLNSGETRKYDMAILYQGAVHDRVVAIQETIQYQILDRLQKAGVTADLEIEEPEFDDRAPVYEIAAKARELPLTNKERRELVGLDPFGNPEIDEAVWLPVGLTEAYPGGEAGPGAPPSANPVPPLLAPFTGMPPEPPAPELPEGKASVRQSLAGLRSKVDKRNVPAMQRSVAAVLAEMRDEIEGKITSRSAHIAREPNDAFWWDEAKWNRRLAAALGPHYQRTAETVHSRVRSVLDSGKADPVALAVADTLLKRAGDRIVSINRATRDAIVDILRSLIAEGVAQGEGAAELAKRVAGISLGGTKVFDEYRAERIARTESMFAYNTSALESYREFGVEMVEPIDGDQDEECQARLERGAVTLDEAASDEDHPNGTLDWVPVLKAEPVPDTLGDLVRAVADMATRPQPAPVVNVTTPVSVTSPPVVIEKGALQFAYSESEHPAPIVNVTTPENVINVPEQKAAAVQDIRIVDMPPSRMHILRDAQGRIAEAIEE